MSINDLAGGRVSATRFDDIMYESTLRAWSHLIDDEQVRADRALFESVRASIRD
mgnify:CR=1 FL=1